MRPSLAVVVVLFVIASIVQAYQDGDVQLVDGGNPTFSGQLQVYFEGKWNTACYNELDKYNKATAIVACRQLGYIDYNKYKRSVDNGLQVVNITCPLVMTSNEAEIHNILRCNVHEMESNYDRDCDRLSIECDKTEYFYNGQVRTFIDDSNNALLEINLEGEWRPICISSANVDMSNSVADSACRQMGYTNSIASNPSMKHHMKSWKIEIHSRCKHVSDISSPCFTDCIAQYTAVDDCGTNSDNGNVYYLTCSFGNDFVIYTSGNENICKYSSQSIDVRFWSVTGGLSFVIIVLSIVVIVQFCRLRYHHRPVAPGGDNQAAAQPNVLTRMWRSIRGYGAVVEERPREHN